MSLPSDSKDFFISYTGVDVDQAKWIAEQLEVAGFTTIYQARDFIAGGNFVLDMNWAMQHTHRTIAVLSREYLAARYTLTEWAEAFRRDPTGEYALLVPVRVKDCEIDGVLGAIVYIDLIGLDAAASSQRLVAMARAAASKPLPPAAPGPLPGTASATAARPLVVAPTGLPLAAALIGRDNALDNLMVKLRDGTTSGVFALEGMGGVGKTALAAEAVARLAEDMQAFPGGAAWIACEGLEGESGMAELWARVARALQLEAVAAQPDPSRRRAMLAAALTQRQRLLLALDNIEPGLDAEAVLDTLAVRNRTALLLTARQRVVPQLVAAIDLAPLESDGARTLFLIQLERNGGMSPTPEEEPALVALLEALGGLPLALELTAAYAGVRRLGLAGVVRELESDGLNALALRNPKRALLKRFERSWLALSARQQRFFASLSLLAGASFPRAAALALAKATVTRGAIDPEGDLLTLVSYALVEALPGGERLRLHPLLREYAAQKYKTLAQTQQARLGDVMVAYWLDYARAHPGYDGMDALESEAAGLMGALDWTHEQARHREVLGLAQALNTLLLVRGRIDEDRRVRLWALEAAQALIDKREERWAVHALAVLDGNQGRLTEARAGFEHALALARQLGDRAAEQLEVHGIAALDARLNQWAKARVGYERALALARQLGDQKAERSVVHDLAVLDADQERWDEARAGYEHALALARQLSDRAGESLELRNLGLLIGQRGDLEQGKAMITEALGISENLNDTFHIGKAHQFLAWLDEDSDNHSEAIEHYREALRCFKQLESPTAEEVRDDLHRLEQT